MGKRKRRANKGTKIRVDLRRNRSRPGRVSDWTRRARDAEGHELDAERSEHIAAKGALSRRRTIVLHDDSEDAARVFREGTAVAMRGLYVDVDDGERVWPCTVRRMLRTRLTEERHPVTVGDRVRFTIGPPTEGGEREGVVEAVAPRTGLLRRRAGRRIHTIVANVDQAVIVTSARQPAPKSHLIDRYIVAALAGGITPVVCMNKMDLATDGAVSAMLDVYARLGYVVLATSVLEDRGINELRETLKGNVSVLAGQSGVGKSSLANALQPGLRLRVADISAQVQKGRHTTATSIMLRLDFGGYLVDTPGVRSFDISTVARNELEACFVEFVEHVRNCRFPNCSHRHEEDCAVKQAVESGEIHRGRYESYVRLFEEAGA